MRPLTTLARPFVAAPYIMTGLDAIRDPRERAERVGSAVKPVADRIEWLPKDPETLVRMEGALSLGTGALMLTGKFRRLTMLLLAAQLVPALATEHWFWTEDDPERRANERSHLLKNAGMFGALLMAATEPRRPPRTAELRRAARETQVKSGAEARAPRREAAATLRDARREAARQIRIARAESGRKAAKQTAKQSARAAKGAKAGAAFKAGKAGGAMKAGKAGAGKAGGAVKSLTAGGKSKMVGAKMVGAKMAGAKTAGAKMGREKMGGASKPGRAARAGRMVKKGTAVQAGKVKHAVLH